MKLQGFGNIESHVQLKTKVKSAPQGLGQFLATENTLNMMKNPFYFTLKAFLILTIFQFQKL